jgi:hypothetical protein
LAFSFCFFLLIVDEEKRKEFREIEWTSCKSSKNPAKDSESSTFGAHPVSPEVELQDSKYLCKRSNEKSLLSVREEARFI